ncbi:acetyl-CoA synthetase-like protein [Aspergillus aculeatinus CBS 121060]|uniref:Acetyl-CoA synthetase-like protein n=1 Tax=Aspergillus aculeatinus CBS 121060 TaxID=1448322 RepID=A0ACD1GVN0_9EURO|nr:acetyl-CoA synthetase-like protein [Aspergillus aculeatinus CBS 121060]RAH65256.1 acetyl-CoA synthetase-like protein [Aspergillus aculeatinus CBS 121060]
MLNESRPDLGLAQLLAQKVQLYADDIALEHGEHRMTFRQLHEKALSIVLELGRLGVTKEQPIGILIPRGINHILAQVAVVHAGAACVPLDIDLPDDHLERLLLHLGTSLILSDNSNSHRLPNLQHLVVNWEPVEREEVDHFVVSDNSPSCCSHILHTSGSTGQPKAVRVLAAGLINLVFNEFAPIRRGHRVAHVCNVGFDVSLWEIWSALLHGGTVVVFQREEFLDPIIFERRLQVDHIDVMWQTTSLLATIAHTCPHAYSHVDSLLTGGEAIHVPTIRTIFANGPPRKLFNVYGPTELSVFTTYHLVTPQDIERGEIPIGRSLSGYDAFVVDENLHPVTQGSVGELLVGGTGVAGGYFGQPEKTARVFVAAPHLHENCQIAPGLFYRTGDLVRRNESGDIVYLGRRDNEVKIRGQRVDLGAIEKALLSTQLVVRAVALRITLDELDGGSALLVCVIPFSPKITANAIRQLYIEQAPHLMVPRIQVVERIALTGSGKVDRKALASHYLQSLARISLRESEVNGTENVEVKLRALWQELLGLPNAAFHDEDDFFILGGTSLHAALLVSHLRQIFGREIRISVLFEHSSFRALCSLLRASDTPALTERKTSAQEEWQRDCRLRLELRPLSRSIPDWRNPSEGVVFLTGATGFVGAFVLAGLLALPEVETVVCLVRATDAQHAHRRIRKSLLKYSLMLTPAQEARIIAMAGDISQEDLGLTPQQYSWLSHWASVVFHLGAHVNFVQPYSSHRAANVLGTLHMIRFANSGRTKALHYTSSISAYGPTGVVNGHTHLAEEEQPASHMSALPFAMGYAQSQMVAETIAWNAISQGLPITIYRLGFVLGHSETGTMNPDDFLTRVIAASLQCGCYPLLPGHREDIVPVDWVVSTLLHIASSSEHARQAYNVVHPTTGSSVELSTIFTLLNQVRGKTPLRAVPCSEWVGILSQTRESPLQSLLPLLEEKVWEGRSIWEMQQWMPEFGTENLCRALADAPQLLECPSPTSLVVRYSPHWLRGDVSNVSSI